MEPHHHIKPFYQVPSKEYNIQLSILTPLAWSVQMISMEFSPNAMTNNNIHPIGEHMHLPTHPSVYTNEHWCAHMQTHTKIPTVPFYNHKNHFSCSYKFFVPSKDITHLLGSWFWTQW